eukprot:8842080-Pyramimonas_sp.AAC.1
MRNSLENASGGLCGKILQVVPYGNINLKDMIGRFETYVLRRARNKVVLERPEQESFGNHHAWFSRPRSRNPFGTITFKGFIGKRLKRNRIQQNM